MSEKEVIREEFKDEKKDLNILQGYDDISKSEEKIETSPDKYSVVILNDFGSNKSDTIVETVDASSDAFGKYKTWAEQNEIALIGNFQNGRTVSINYSTYEMRSKVISELYEKVMKKGYQGVCLQFDEIDDINSFQRFVIELTPKFRDSGLKVFVKVRDESQKEKLKKIVDYVI